MDLEQALELRGAGGLGHLRQRFHELLFRVQDIAKLIDQEFLDGLRLREIGAFGMDRRALRQVVPDVLESRGLDELPLLALVPRAAGIDLALIALPGGVVEELVDEPGGGRDAADDEAGLAETLERGGERLHVSD